MAQDRYYGTCKKHMQVPENANSREWNLCFQKVTYHYDDEENSAQWWALSGYLK